jgi:hypothetical protein
MSALTSSSAEEPNLAVQIEASTKTKPKTLFLLGDWQYVERSLHRLMAAWGRYFPDWEDKCSLHRHVWEQSECVRRLRQRMEEFVGGKPDAAVSAKLERLANTVLLAPSFQDAVDGIYAHLTHALVKSYLEYIHHAHSVHDAPTIAMLHEICTMKEQHRLWFHDFRRRHPHTTDAAYVAVINREVESCGRLTAGLPIEGEPAKPCGVATDFRLPRSSARTPHWKPKHDIALYVRQDFETSIETRRLWWAYAYMLEMNLPDDQLRWIYWGHFMPWAWHQDISRHLWDESRHGDSGYSRLKDFGISMDEVGFPPYQKLGDPEGGIIDLGPDEPLTAKDLYEEVYLIGMVAETVHFQVKNESYADFRDGGDMESAEMMLFDVIDETTHVQYAHRWLPVLAEFGEVTDHPDYKKRSSRDRAKCEAESRAHHDGDLAKPRDPADPAFIFYQDLLARARKARPLTNATTCPPRQLMPM